MQKLLKWHGRVGRAEFFSYTFGLNILSGVISLLGGYLPGSLFSSLFKMALYFFLTYLCICLVMRRLHDLNKPGWYYPAFAATLISLVYIGDTFLIWIKYIGLPLGLYCVVAIYCFKGTDGDNQYGPDPLAPTITETNEDTAAE